MRNASNVSLTFLVAFKIKMTTLAHTDSIQTVLHRIYTIQNVLYGIYTIYSVINVSVRHYMILIIFCFTPCRLLHLWKYFSGTFKAVQPDRWRQRECPHLSWQQARARERKLPWGRRGQKGKCIPGLPALIGLLYVLAFLRTRSFHVSEPQARLSA